MHRGASCQFPFQCIYYYDSNKSSGKETGKCTSVQCQFVVNWLIEIEDATRTKEEIKEKVKDQMFLSGRYLYIFCVNFELFLGNFSNGLIFGNNYLVNGMKNLTKILFLCWLKFERVSYLYLLVDFDLIIKTSQLDCMLEKEKFP